MSIKVKDMSAEPDSAWSSMVAPAEDGACKVDGDCLGRFLAGFMLLGGLHNGLLLRPAGGRTVVVVALVTADVDSRLRRFRVAVDTLRGCGAATSLIDLVDRADMRRDDGVVFAGFGLAAAAGLLLE